MKQLHVRIVEKRDFSVFSFLIEDPHEEQSFLLSHVPPSCVAGAEAEVLEWWGELYPS